MTSEETFDRVLHKTADRHRSDSARDRGYHRSLRLYGSEIDIPAQPAGLGIAVEELHLGRVPGVVEKIHGLSFRAVEIWWARRDSNPDPPIMSRVH